MSEIEKAAALRIGSLDASCREIVSAHAIGSGKLCIEATCSGGQSKYILLDAFKFDRREIQFSNCAW